MPARNDSNDTLLNDGIYAPQHYNQRVNHFQNNLDGFKLVIMGSVGMHNNPPPLSTATLLIVNKPFLYIRGWKDEPCPSLHRK